MPDEDGFIREDSTWSIAGTLDGRVIIFFRGEESEGSLTFSTDEARSLALQLKRMADAVEAACEETPGHTVQ